MFRVGWPVLTHFLYSTCCITAMLVSFLVDEKANTHLLLGMCLDAYARYLLLSKYPSQAQRMYEKALHISEEILGETHPQVSEENRGFRIYRCVMPHSSGIVSRWSPVYSPPCAPVHSFSFHHSPPPPSTCFRKDLRLLINYWICPEHFE